MTHYQHKSVNIYSFTAAETDNKAKFRCEATNPYLATPLTANLQLTVLFPPSQVSACLYIFLPRRRGGEIFRDLGTFLIFFLFGGVLVF